jgi:predicted ATPase
MRLPRADKERLLELESEHFINVIQSIDRKGKMQGRNIAKISTMQAMRRRNVHKNKDILDDF